MKILIIVFLDIGDECQSQCKGNPEKAKVMMIMMMMIMIDGALEHAFNIIDFSHI